jgi:hypothetical protein
VYVGSFKEVGVYYDFTDDDDLFSKRAEGFGGH